MMKKKDEIEENDFDSLVNKFGANLDEETLKKLLDTNLTTYPQYWIFLIGVIFTLVNMFLDLELTILTIEEAIGFLFITALFAVGVSWIIMKLFMNNPLQRNTNLVMQYENARINLMTLKESDKKSI